MVVETAANPAPTTQPRTATDAAVESVASTYSADAPEKRAVPVAFSAPLTPSNAISAVVPNLMAWAGLSPSVSNTPSAPVESPAPLAVLAWMRRQYQQTLVDETPTISKTPVQTSQPAPSVVSDVTTVPAPVTVTVANAATSAQPAAVLNQPANPGLLMYADGAPPVSVVANWAKPGALVVVGRTNYNDPWVHTMAAGGATVLLYVDPVIDNDTGRYHDKLLNASEFGPAVPKWPGNPVANEWGSLNDFRVGSVLQQKLPGVLELAVAENPDISGFFLDDVGSRSWFPGINWDSWSNADKEAYRNGAIAITQTAGAVADENDLFLMVNGTWGATGVAGRGGGGYPNRALHGNSLVDGGFVENHDPDTQFAYWAAYADPDTSQWGADTPRGLPYMWFSNVGSSADRDKWIASGLAAFASSSPYDGRALPFGTFTDFHLPNRATTQL